MVDSISTWKYIFLDTSVIIDLLQNPEKLEKNKKHQKRVIDTQKLFNYFKMSKESSDTKYIFYISSVTVSELTLINNELFNILLQLFSSGDLTFVDFTKEIAFNISKNVKDFVPKYSYNQLVSHIKKNIAKENSIVNTRNWVEDDLKIACSAKILNRLDVVLTADEKTFSPICDNLKIPYVKTSNLPKDMFDEIDTSSVNF
jgi:hypothetical protein